LCFSQPGSTAGLALGLAGGHVLASIVYQASAFDPLVIASVAFTMAGIGFLSAFGPARRTPAAEPAILLRVE
jgi:ABC-type antimicrobial peptide transport system permease subunit